MRTEPRSVPMPLEDALLERMLARRAAGGVPPELRIAVLGQVAATRRPWWLVARRFGPAARLGWAAAGVALIAALVGGALVAGARPARDATPFRPAVVAPPDTPRPVAARDGTAVSGTWTYVDTTESKNPAHAGVSTFHVEADAPDVTGDGSYDAAIRWTGGVAATTGVIRITSDDGAWWGTCTGADWPADGFTSVALSCWLSGRGGFSGRTLYLQLLGGADVPMRVDGIVYPGEAPVPEEAQP